MKQFMLIYSGPSPEIGNGSPQEISSAQAEWQQMTQALSSSLVDEGKLFVNSSEVIDTGEFDDFVPMNGYSIIQADSMDAAVALARAHPYLSKQDGRYSIMIFELMTEPASAYASAPPAAVPGQTLPPPAPIEPDTSELPAPQNNGGELSISHEAPQEEQPPTQPPQNPL